jgi:EpsI family protein
MAAGMIDRRGLLLGGACVAAAVGAELLKPHREAHLLSGAKLAEVVPPSFGAWTSEDVPDVLAVNGEGTLTAKLYNELVVRNYKSAASGATITMLLAYGARQTDDLQLHRPEICYPAFGYALTRAESVALPIASGVTLPARQLLAELEDQRESIIYWSRLGEYFPQDASQQRAARFNTTLKGVVADGVLARFATPGPYPERGWSLVSGFIQELLPAIAPERRKVLVGTERGRQLERAAPPPKSL